MTEERHSKTADKPTRSELGDMVVILYEVLILQLPVKNDTDIAIAEGLACDLTQLLYDVDRDIDRFRRCLRDLGRTSECKGAPSWKKLSHTSKRIHEHLKIIYRLKQTNR